MCAPLSSRTLYNQVGRLKLRHEVAALYCREPADLRVGSLSILRSDSISMILQNGAQSIFLPPLPSCFLSGTCTGPWSTRSSSRKLSTLAVWNSLHISSFFALIISAVIPLRWSSLDSSFHACFWPMLGATECRDATDPLWRSPPITSSFSSCSWIPMSRAFCSSSWQLNIRSD